MPILFSLPGGWSPRKSLELLEQRLVGLDHGVARGDDVLSRRPPRRLGIEQDEEVLTQTPICPLCARARGCEL